MRNPLSTGALLLALTVCFSGFSQRKPRIKGNRSVVTVEKELPPFSHLVLADDLDLHLEQGSRNAVRIEADDNLVDILRFEVEGDTLKVGSFYRITSSKKLDLTLEFEQLESLQAGTGRVDGSTALVADRLDLRLSGAGRAQLNIRAALLNLRMEENSYADLRVEADSLHADLRGHTDAHIYANGAGVNLTMTGQASLGLEGTGPALTASLTDNTRLQASGLQVEKATAFLNTSAHARIHAAAELGYEGRGNARLFVYGQPQIRILGLFDSAELHKVPE